MELSVTELRLKIKRLESENDLLYRALSDMIQRFDIQPSTQIEKNRKTLERRWIILGKLNF